MAKKIYNYEVFTHKRDQLKEIQQRRLRHKRMKQIAALVIVVFCIFVFNIISQSRCDYYYYKEEIKTEENSGVNYDTFSEGCIKYSSNGIEYQSPFGVARWNIALSYSKPFLAKKDKYILLGDKGGNQVILFDTQGKVQEYTMKYPLVQLDVAKNGNIVTILEADDCNYIQVYDVGGDLIAETKTTLGETGYPLTVAISPDGTQLAVSYYLVENMKGKSRVAFYDFSKQIQQDTIPLNGAFDYNSTLIPKLQFLSDNKMAAFAHDVIYYFNASDEPRVQKTIRFDGNIESVFSGEKCFGVVCDNDKNDKGRYRVYLYNKNGGKSLDCYVDMNYDNIYMVGKEIFATKDNECTILNENGKILFQGELEGGRIERVLPCFGWKTYRFVFGNKIVKLQLSFFDRNK